MNTDLSNEAALEEYRRYADGDFPYEEDAYLKGWRECRNRAAQREVVAFQEGWEAAIQTYGPQ